MVFKILIVGAGFSGAAVSYFIRRLASQAESSIPISLCAWDRSLNIGGRMETHIFRNELHSPFSSCDMGAQYITLFESDTASDCLLDELINQKCLQSFDAVSKIAGVRDQYARLPHFLSNRGLSSCTEVLIGNIPLHLGREVVGITTEMSTRQFQVKFKDGVGTLEKLNEEAFDCIVLTTQAPVTESLLAGLIKDKSLSIFERLRQVRYSSRFALAATFQLPSSLARRFYDAFSTKLAFYNYDDEIVRYVSIESGLKASEDIKIEQNLETTESISIVGHSTIPFYTHLQESLRASSQNILDIVSDEVRAKIVTDMMSGIERILLRNIHENGYDNEKLLSLGLSRIEQTYLREWKYSQVVPDKTLHFEKPSETIQLGDLSIVLAGDYFSTSNFQGCAISAFSAAQDVQKIYENYVATSGR